MSWHVSCYTASLGSVTDTDTPALTDDILTILNGHFVLRKPMQLIGTYAGGGTTTRVRLDSPTIRYYGNPLIRPFDNSATPSNNYNFQYYDLQNPLTLPPGEEIAVQWTTSGAGPTQVFAFIFLTDGIQAVAGGNIYPVRFTSTTAATALKWSTVGNPITMQQAFPTGGFELIYSEVQSATGIAHRWIFDEQLNRPGFISIAALANRTPYWQIGLPFGVMGRFINTSLPRLQVFCTAADASFEGVLYVRALGQNIQAIFPQGQPYLAGA